MGWLLNLQNKIPYHGCGPDYNANLGAIRFFFARIYSKKAVMSEYDRYLEVNKWIEWCVVVKL